MENQNIDEKNQSFWDELCGSQLARSLGITDSSPASLKKFDDWYMAYYPYLYRHIPFQTFAGKKVLEIGLGYGTVAQLIAQHGADYTGLDIANGPVVMANHRLEQMALKGHALQGSILEPPFEKESFDYIVAIGCLHHTGHLAGAIENVYKLLKVGGGATIMVYNAASHRQFSAEPLATLKRLFSSPVKYLSINSDDEKLRKAYDSNKDGDAAPYTEFVTKNELRYLCRQFDKCQIHPENISLQGQLSRIPRPVACRILGPILGLDLYCRVTK